MIPRLELCASELVAEVHRALNIKFKQMCAIGLIHEY